MAQIGATWLLQDAHGSLPVSAMYAVLPHSHKIAMSHSVSHKLSYMALYSPDSFMYIKAWLLHVTMDNDRISKRLINETKLFLIWINLMNCNKVTSICTECRYWSIMMMKSIATKWTTTQTCPFHPAAWPHPLAEGPKEGGTSGRMSRLSLMVGTTFPLLTYILQEEWAACL